MTRVKICGLTRMEDIEAVNRTLPDFVGFVFAPSRRRLDIKTAAKLRERLDPRIKAVGVFTDEAEGVVSGLYRDGIIDLAQLHGDEDGGYIERLKRSCSCPVIKAVGISDALPDLPICNEGFFGPDFLIFDTLSTQRGGVGKAFDWNILRGYNGIPFFLAGGLTLENVIDGVALLAPYCVDVSSGVETDGLKDAKKIERFVHLVKNVSCCP